MEVFSFTVSVSTTFCFTKQAELFIISRRASRVPKQTPCWRIELLFKVVFNALSSNQRPRHSRKRSRQTVSRAEGDWPDRCFEADSGRSPLALCGWVVFVGCAVVCVSLGKPWRLVASTGAQCQSGQVCLPRRFLVMLPPPPPPPPPLLLLLLLPACLLSPLLPPPNRPGVPRTQAGASNYALAAAVIFLLFYLRFITKT